MSTPALSVILPVHNGAAFIEAALRSILKQDFPDFELLVIDDASSDATPDILARLAQEDARLTVLREGRLGLVGALNLGIARARAPLVARMDADDLARSDRFSKQVAYLAAHPDVAVLGGQMAFMGVDGTLNGEISRFACAPAEIRAAMEAGRCIIAHPTVMARREVLLHVGGYRAAYLAGEDIDLWLRVLEHGEIAALPDVVLDYRQHAGQVSRTAKLRQWFSTELATASGALRRAGVADPTAGFAAPLDWHDGAEITALGPLGAIARAYAAMDKALNAPSSEALPLEALAQTLGEARRNRVGRARLRQAALQALARRALRAGQVTLALRLGVAVLREALGRKLG